MKSNKQRRAEIRATRLMRQAARPMLKGGENQKEIPPDSMAPCSLEQLQPSNSYGVPDFVRRGHYLDLLFCCTTCQKQEVWRAAQQKWWYEVAKGHLESRAKLCNACRRTERDRKTEARRVHLEGLKLKRDRTQSR